MVVVLKVLGNIRQMTLKFKAAKQKAIASCNAVSKSPLRSPTPVRNETGTKTGPLHEYFRSEFNNLED